ncbi:MAG: hypothetical protein A6F71_09880 [Cycloclasticus sp. symbiont of Poecilosclerida sp. M]|nr:MAG: hypothetical protein A6F71_09880 [Cycloclasticus sp. symbiont of Poecilosclerida sp. M]
MVDSDFKSLKHVATQTTRVRRMPRLRETNQNEMRLIQEGSSSKDQMLESSFPDWLRYSQLVYTCVFNVLLLFIKEKSEKKIQ